MIRAMNIHDKPAIMALGASIFRKDDEMPLLKKALLQCAIHLSFVAIDDNTIIGFTLVCITPTNVYFRFQIPYCFELAFLGVSPYHQGLGIGSRLLKETLLHIFKQSTQFTCWLLVDKINTGAIKMYEKLGFRLWMSVSLDEPGYIMGLSHRRYKHSKNSNLLPLSAHPDVLLKQTTICPMCTPTPFPSPASHEAFSNPHQTHNAPLLLPYLLD